MLRFPKIATTCLLMAVCAAGLAQTDERSASRESDELKTAALEALISAPPRKALPIVTKVLQGEGSDALKERALFVLSQIDLPEAQALLVDTARGGGRLGREAIRMIGIGGNAGALAELSALYTGGDHATRKAVLEAYLIADDAEAVYRIAADSQDAETFKDAVEVLGAMGATDQLRALRNRTDMAASLINAYAVAGDTESLRELATDGSDPERQAQAIRGLGIAGDDRAGEILVGIYGSTDSARVKDAVREGLLISGDDEAVLRLFRQSTDDAEKTELLQTLVMMDSEAVWEIIDATLENGQ